MVILTIFGIFISLASVVLYFYNGTQEPFVFFCGIIFVAISLYIAKLSGQIERLTDRVNKLEKTKKDDEK